MTHTACNHEIKRLENEITRLRAANEELVEVLEKLARLGNGSEYGNSDGNMIARAALSRAEQAKPETETCRWTWGPILGWQSQCKGMIQDSGLPPEVCTSCGGKVEAWDVDGKRVEVKG